MTKKQLLLERIKVAAYEGDEAKVVRLIVERRSLATYQACMEMVALGRKLRAMGAK